MPLDHTHSLCCTVEAAFPLHGAHLPIHHGAALYAALCGLPDIGAWLMEADDIAVAPIAGRTEPDGRLALTPDSRLLLRLPAAELPRVLGLTDQRLEVAGCALGLGEPQVRLPSPVATLRAGLVVFEAEGEPGLTSTAGDHARAASSPEAFGARVRRQLAALEIPAEPVLGRPGHLQLPGHSAPGFGLEIAALTPDDSLHLQEAGLGEHRKLGCGVFVPA
jgi:CRISPR-associated protein Cas6